MKQVVKSEIKLGLSFKILMNLGYIFQLICLWRT